MSRKSRDQRPYARPVSRIELPQINVKMRMVLLVLFLTIAAVAFAIGVKDLVTTEPGWQEVTVSSKNLNCSDSFQLMYDFTEDGGNATANYRSINSIYTEATEELFQLFSASVSEDGLYNVAYLNAHIGETVVVEPELYEALSLIDRYDCRFVFQAPVMAEYDRLFQCEGDGEAALYDPMTNEETSEWVKTLSGYISDPSHVSLELLGENQVRLVCSDEYREFCQEYEIETILDFGWMTNAFLADAIANRLTEKGFTNGYLVSLDGFTRNLDTRGTKYALTLYDAQGTDVYMPGEITYGGPMSMVVYRNFPLTEGDRWSYYTFSDGRIVSSYVDTADGVNKTAASSMTCYSSTLSCGEILLQTADIYVAEYLDMDEIATLKQQTIYTVWSDGKRLCYNDDQLNIQYLPESGSGYSLEYVK